VLRWGDGLYGFSNCPHWSVTWTTAAGDFYDAALDAIVCKNHGALFHPQTGFCEWGPCTGHSSNASSSPPTATTSSSKSIRLGAAEPQPNSQKLL